MKISGAIKGTYFIIVLFVGVIGYLLLFPAHTHHLKAAELGTINKSSPPSLQVFYLIEKYSDKYDIPKYIAFNVAYLETKYRGPFDWKYNPYLTSSAGAVGPMQVMVQTANGINKKKTTKHQLKNDLELNISTSMKLLHRLYGRYGSWEISLGYYNTGMPIVNGYAIYASSTKEYKLKWKSGNFD